VNTVIKLKKCRECPKEFRPFNSLDAWCSPKCKIAGKKKKDQEKENRLPKLVMGVEIVSPKKMQELLEYTQNVVNAYIKIRDRLELCISCEALGKDVVWHTGHFRTIGAAPHLRFNFNNMHKQCQHCNETLSGNVIEMEKEMIKRIGVEKVEALKNDNEIRRYTPEYLKRVRKIAALKKRKLERQS